MQETLADFETQLNNVLLHLYDPSLRPAPLVWQVIGHSPSEGTDVLQTAIIQAVEDLRPADYVPKSARSWRIYGILYYRFISNMTQEEVADRVGITPRHLRREQIGAIQILAQKLWENARLPLPEMQDKEPETAEVVGETAGENHQDEINPEEQLRNDLLSLTESAPGVISDVNLVIHSVIALTNKIPAGKEIHVHYMPRPEQVKASLHPSALRQVLWMIVRQAIEQPGTFDISIQYGHQGSRVYIQIAIMPTLTYDPQRSQTINEIIEAQNGTLLVTATPDALTFRIELLLVNRTLLVVDDNPDIVHLYQRYLVNTAYHLVHVANGQDVFGQIEHIRPDVIVLDIMLPDVDGWDLLTRLSEHPDTRQVPVIVCSVVNDPDLAMALGARQSLSKPVQRQSFLTALDQAVNAG